MSETLRETAPETDEVARICGILRRHFAEKVRDRPLGPMTELASDLSMDSIDLLTLVSLLEDQLGRAVLDERTESAVFATIDTLSRHLQGAGGGPRA